MLAGTADYRNVGCGRVFFSKLLKFELCALWTTNIQNPKNTGMSHPAGILYFCILIQSANERKERGPTRGIVVVVMLVVVVVVEGGVSRFRCAGVEEATISKHQNQKRDDVGGNNTLVYIHINSRYTHILF